MANYLFFRMSGRKVALVNVNSDYGIGVVNAFEKEYTRLGGSVIFKGSFLPGTTDFKSMVIKIKKASPDVVYLVGNPAENGYFIRQLRNNKIYLPITGNLAFENNDFITVAKGTFDSIIYSTAAYDLTDESQVVQSFLRAYIKCYNKTPNMEAGLGYDVVNIIIHCLRETEFRMDMVKDKMYTVKDFPGVTGNTTFDKYGDVMKDIYIKRMAGDGSINLIESYRFTNNNK